MHESAADELTRVRGQIAQLRSRERDLCAEVLAAGPDGCVGRWSRVEIVARKLRVFDPGLLPAILRDDPRYWRERVLTELRCEPQGVGMLGAADAALIGMAQ